MGAESSRPPAMIRSRNADAAARDSSKAGAKTLNHSSTARRSATRSITTGRPGSRSSRFARSAAMPGGSVTFAKPRRSNSRAMSPGPLAGPTYHDHGSRRRRYHSRASSISSGTSSCATVARRTGLNSGDGTPVATRNARASSTTSTPATAAKPRMNSHWLRSSASAISGPSIPRTGSGAVMARSLSSALSAAQPRCRLRDAASELCDLLIRQMLSRNAGLLELVTHRSDRLRLLDGCPDLHEAGHHSRVVAREGTVLRRLEHPAVERLGFLEAEGERDLVAGPRSGAIAGRSRIDVGELCGGGCGVLHFWRECNPLGGFGRRISFSSRGGPGRRFGARPRDFEELLETEPRRGRIRVDDDARHLVVANRDDPALARVDRLLRELVAPLQDGDHQDVVADLAAVLRKDLEAVGETVVHGLERGADLFAAARGVELVELGRGVELHVWVQRLDASIDLAVLEGAPEPEPHGYVVFLRATRCCRARSHPGPAMLGVTAAESQRLQCPP